MTIKSNVDSTPQTWAVLIGVDAYTERPLKGCVNDVNAVERYLLRYRSVKLSKFVAGRGQHDKTPLPTYTNITQKLKAIAKQANKGDYVLIYYSGHGSRFEHGPEPHYRSDVALVLPELKQGIRYLEGIHLAYLIKKLLEQGLLVTLVLDCCFSGDVTRDSSNGEGIRGVEWDESIYQKALMCKSRILRSIEAIVPESRDTQWRYEWLETAENMDYTLLLACGPHEKAGEQDFDGTYRGVLSFYLIQSLEQLQRKNRSNCLIESLLGHLRSQIQNHGKKQNPMLRGNKEISFLTRNRSATAAYAYIEQVQGPRIHLNIGHVHRVSKDDIYLASPFDFKDHEASNARSAPARLRVTTIRSFTCVAHIESPHQESNIQIGWKASLFRCSVQPIRVQICCEGRRKSDVAKAIEQCRFPRLLASGANQKLPKYSIMINEKDEYEIHDHQSKQTCNIPKFQAKSSKAIRRVTLSLEHIAHFELIKSLRNSELTDSFKRSFKVVMRYKKGNVLNEESETIAKHNQHFEVEVTNGSDGPLYTWIYSLGSSWQVDFSDEVVVEPKDRGKQCNGKSVREITMKVPPSQDQCKDTVIVLITTRPIPTALLRLPKLQERQEFRDLQQEVRPGLEDVISQENVDTPTVPTDRDIDFSSSQSTQCSHDDRRCREEWSIHTYRIKVIRDQDQR